MARWRSPPSGRSRRDQLTLDRILAESLPLSPAVLDGQFDLRVDKLRVLQHLGARLVGACVAQLRFDGEWRCRPAGRQSARADGGQKAVPPFFGFSATAEARVYLHR